MSFCPYLLSPPRSQSATMRRRAAPPLTKLGSSSQPLVSWCWGVGAFTLEGLGKFAGQVSVWEASSWGHFQVMPGFEWCMGALGLSEETESCKGVMPWNPLHRLCELQREREKPIRPPPSTPSSLETPGAPIAPDSLNHHHGCSLGFLSSPCSSFGPQRMVW